MGLCLENTASTSFIFCLMNLFYDISKMDICLTLTFTDQKERPPAQDPDYSGAACCNVFTEGCFLFPEMVMSKRKGAKQIVGSSNLRSCCFGQTMSVFIFRHVGWQIYL